MAQDRFPYQAVIFDMDGVIVDTERFYFDQLDEMYTAAGMPVSYEELCRAVGAITQGLSEEPGSVVRHGRRRAEHRGGRGPL